jgi:ABC-type branched-subunit amino acid transport system ATPase component
VYLVGITSIAGGVAAGFVAPGGVMFVVIQRWGSLSSWYQVVLALLLVITLIVHPEGIAQAWHYAADWLEKRRHRRQHDAEPDADPHAAEGPSVAQGTMPPAELATSSSLSLAGGVVDGPLLVARHIRVTFGGVVAVADVSVSLNCGEIAGIIGPNGAGKTTFIDALSGFAKYDGQVILGGLPLDGLPPHKRIRAGMGRTLQAIELYDDLNVEENVQAGLRRTDRATASRVLGETLDLLGLARMRGVVAGELSQGQRQLVSIARALVGQPRVLLLDEPAAGLDTTETQWLADRLRDIRDAGVSLMLIDHDMSLVLGLCDKVNVLDFGQLIASGPPATIRSDPRVTAAYLGSVGVDLSVSTPRVAEAASVGSSGMEQRR